MSKRSFSPDEVKEKGKDYHGGCQFVRTKPGMEEKGIESLNIDLKFEDALRLATAIQSAVMNLNRYDRRNADGRRMGLMLSIKRRGSAISIMEVRLPKS